MALTPPPGPVLPAKTQLPEQEQQQCIARGHCPTGDPGSQQIRHGLIIAIPESGVEFGSKLSQAGLRLSSPTPVERRFIGRCDSRSGDSPRLKNADFLQASSMAGMRAAPDSWAFPSIFEAPFPVRITPVNKFAHYVSPAAPHARLATTTSRQGSSTLPRSHCRRQTRRRIHRHHQARRLTAAR
jgi:hypothetical protein